VSTKDDEDALLRSTALQNAASILVARQRAEQRSEAYLAEAQRLSHTGSFGWKPSTGEIIWSDETFRIFQYDRATTPSIERVLHRVHPEDAALVQETIERAAQTGRDFDFEHRLLMPDRSVRHCHVVARASRDGRDRASPSEGGPGKGARRDHEVGEAASAHRRHDPDDGLGHTARRGVRSRQSTDGGVLRSDDGRASPPGLFPPGPPGRGGGDPGQVERGPRDGETVRG